MSLLPYCYEYPRPSVTVDLVAFTLEGDAIRVLLIRRGKEPFAGSWAIPGGFLDLDEPPAAAALRELKEETGLEEVEHLAPIGFFAGVDRDPRGRVISLAHAGIVRAPAPAVLGSDDANEAAWVDPASVDAFAFDHAAILAAALHWLVFGVNTGPLGLTLLPETFTLADVKRLFSAVGGTPQAASAWLRRLQRDGSIEAIPGAKGRFRAATPSPEPVDGALAQ